MIGDDSQLGYRFHGRTGQINCLFLSGQEKKKNEHTSLNLMNDTCKVFTPSGLKQPKHRTVPGLFIKTLKKKNN